MTDNITPGNETPSDNGHPESGTLEHIDPRDLVLDTNVRDDADLDAEFVASIKEHQAATTAAAALHALATGDTSADPADGNMFHTWKEAAGTVNVLCDRLAPQ